MTRFLAVLALAAAFIFGAAAPASAGVDDFHFDSFDGQYSLSTDAEGHSTLAAVETLVAVFPDTDQNRGIRLGLVDRYDGHPTDLTVQSVTDGNGTPRHYESETDSGLLILTIADDGVYVHGQQTYVVTYTQRNVTKFYSDTKADEFYWDTNGTGWAQGFDRVSATVTLDPELQERLNGKVAAVWGAKQATNPAEAQKTPTGFEFTATGLGSGQNLTFAIGFDPDTFVPRDSGFFTAPWPSLAAGSMLLVLLSLAGAVLVRRRLLRDAPGRGIIVPQYVPPKDANIFLSAVIIKKFGKWTVAGILKLAVAGNIRIRETATKKPSYELELMHSDGVDADEREFLQALFGEQLTPGGIRNLKKSDQKAAKLISKLLMRVNKASISSGYRRKVPGWVIVAVVGASTIGTLAAVVFSTASLGEAFGGWVPIVFLIASLVGEVAVVVLVSKTPLEAAGVELRDYLKGLEVYIRLAEADRLRYLQSPQGAQRVRIATDDTAQMVKLNERLLPYAALFGLEKEWAIELGRYYEEQGGSPSWYSGTSAFSGAVFASSIGTMSTSTSSTFSSSSGGSGGGASSGGGGGGGGGGGV